MSELNDFVTAQHAANIEMAKSQARTEQMLEDMSKRLFGGEGQQGILPHMIEKVEIVAKEAGCRAEKIEVRVGALEGWRGTSRAWLAGAVAVLGLEGTALGIYFSKVAAHVSTIQQALKH